MVPVYRKGPSRRPATRKSLLFLVRDLPHQPNASMAARYTTTIAMLTKVASIKGSLELVGSGCGPAGPHQCVRQGCSCVKWLEEDVRRNLRYCLIGNTCCQKA